MRFSARLRRASGNQRAPGILSPSTNTTAPLREASYAAEIPGVRPELFRALDRPAVEIGIAVQLEPALSHHLSGELRELRLLDGALARLPKYPRHGRRHGGVSRLQLSLCDFAQHYMAHG
jgi:hypothetical protein